MRSKNSWTSYKGERVKWLWTKGDAYVMENELHMRVHTRGGYVK